MESVTSAVEGDDSNLRRSSRQIQRTEAMGEYMNELAAFKLAYERWKGHARVCKECAKKECSETEYGNLADNLKSYEREVIKIFELLRNAYTPNPDVVRKVDDCSSVTNEIINILNELISGAAADLVEKRAELAAREEEGKHQIKLEMQRAELKTTEARKNVEVAAARLRELKRAEENIVDNVKSEPVPGFSRQLHDQSASSEITSHSFNNQNKDLFTMPQAGTSLKRETPQLPFGFYRAASSDNHGLSATSYMYNVTPQLSTMQTVSSTVPHGVPAVPNFPQNTSYAFYAPENVISPVLARAIADSLNLSQMPVPEPTIFTGDPLQFLEWRISYETLIEQNGISKQDKIYYLRRYVNGAAKKAIEGYFTAAVVSRMIVQERY